MEKWTASACYVDYSRPVRKQIENNVDTMEVFSPIRHSIRVTVLSMWKIIGGIETVRSGNLVCPCFGGKPYGIPLDKSPVFGYDKDTDKHPETTAEKEGLFYAEAETDTEEEGGESL